VTQRQPRFHGEPPPARFNLARYALEAQAAAHPAKPALAVVLDAGVTEQSERWSYVALASHPPVAEFAVAEVDAGDGRHIIAALVVPRDIRATSPESLRAYAQTVLAGYKCPKEIVSRPRCRARPMARSTDGSCWRFGRVPSAE
jgi:acyl-CoA synthetase (AMP-forming)/AMP-acid ligase II